MTQHTIAALASLELAKRKRRRQALDATCPDCTTDLLHTIEVAAREWEGYGPPSTVTVECPNCQKPISFDLSWEAVLKFATQIEDSQ